MKTLSLNTFIVSLFAAFLISCSGSDKPCISNYPTTLQFDSLMILSMHVFDMNGELDTVDQQLINLQLVKIKDSMQFFNSDTAALYWHSKNWGNNEPEMVTDTLILNIQPDSFQTSMISLPDVLIEPNTSVPIHNAQVIKDTATIRKTQTKVYYKSGRKFYLEQYAVKLMTPSPNNPLKFNGYTIGGLNKVDVQTLRDNLDPNEYLSIIKYCEILTMQ